MPGGFSMKRVLKMSLLLTVLFVFASIAEAQDNVLGGQLKKSRPLDDTKTRKSKEDLDEASISAGLEEFGKISAEASTAEARADVLKLRAERARLESHTKNLKAAQARLKSDADGIHRELKAQEVLTREARKLHALALKEKQKADREVAKARDKLAQVRGEERTLRDKTHDLDQGTRQANSQSRATYMQAEVARGQQFFRSKRRE
jgi:chromosome segregation ATPase